MPEDISTRWQYHRAACAPYRPTHLPLDLDAAYAGQHVRLSDLTRYERWALMGALLRFVNS